MAKGIFFGLLKRRELVVPSLSGWALLLFALAVFLCLLVKNIHPFLAVEAPLGGQALVMEGWIPDYAQRAALEEFRSHHYRWLITTGGPLPPGTPYSDFDSYANLAGESLKAMGLGADSLLVVASQFAFKDRTYLEAVALRAWMRETHRDFPTLDVVSFSVHARRTRLVYAKALRGVARVGIYAPADLAYDSRRWWRASAGVRSVVDEAVGYLYARLWFDP